jgi:thiol:disulfide interchange protein/DsbC/DsbD-like thiol-disulfide interchange protein
MLQAARTGLLPLILLIGLLMLPAASAQFGASKAATDYAPGPANGGNAFVSFLAPAQSVAAGDTITVGLQFDVAPGWHIYWKNPGDSGLPARIDWARSEGATGTGIHTWPAPHEQPLDGLMNYGYEGEVVMLFDVTIEGDASGSITLDADVSYLICLDICIPEDVKLRLSLPVTDETRPDTANLAALDAARAAFPGTFTGNATLERGEMSWTLALEGEQATAFAKASHVRFFPDDHQIEHPPTQPLSIADEGIVLGLTPAAGFGKDGPLTGVIVAEFEDGRRTGLEVSARPGGMPDWVASAVAAGPGGDGAIVDGGMRAASGTLMGLGTALLLALIGGMILNLMPCVLPVLSLKAIGLAQAAAKGEASHLRLHGLAYIAGVVISMLVLAGVLISLKLAGESAGIGTQLQYPPIVAIFAILIFLVGLNLYGLFEIGGSLVGVGGNLAQKQGLPGAFFTGVLAAALGAPCIGPFLGAASGWALGQSAPVILLFFAVMGLGLALPFALISFAPGLQKLLPKPGMWMVRLRQFFAFPMFATAIWLVWVLAINPSAGPNAVAATLLAALLITMAIWIFQSLGEKRSVFRYAAMGLAGVALIGGTALAVTGTTYRPSNLNVIEWSPDAVTEARADGRAVFVDFTAAWCVTCQSNKITTLRNGKVVDAFADHNVAFMEADWTDRNDLIAAELEKYGRAGVPLYLYFPEAGGDAQVLNQILSPNYVVGIVENDGLKEADS